MALKTEFITIMHDTATSTPPNLFLIEENKSSIHGTEGSIYLEFDPPTQDSNYNFIIIDPKIAAYITGYLY